MQSSDGSKKVDMCRIWSSQSEWRTRMNVFDCLFVASIIVTVVSIFPLYSILFYRYSTTAEAIQEFVASLKERTPGSAGVSTEAAKTPKWITGGLGVVGVSALAASLAADWLPTF